MQWSGGPNAGFSSGSPWLPVPASYTTHNVATELSQPDSVLQFYRGLLKLRHTDPALLEGEYIALNPGDPDVLSYLRRYRNEALLVVLNMSGERQHFRVDLTSLRLPNKARTVMTTLRGVPEEVVLGDVALEPFGVFIGRLVE